MRRAIFLGLLSAISILGSVALAAVALDLVSPPDLRVVASHYRHVAFR